MKISSIEITNVLGIKNLSAQLDAPITVITAPNGGGKSSIAESIRMAFGGDPERVRLKGEYKNLIHDKDGAKKGMVSLTVDGEGVLFNLPKGDTTADYSDKHALPYVLTPSLFTSLKADERRAFLFKLSGQALSREKVKAELLELGADDGKATEVLAYLRGGFPAAVEHAESMLKDCRGAWRGVTGEVYGVQKAADWQPQEAAAEPDQIDIDNAQAIYSEAEAALSVANRELGELTEKARAWAEYQKSYVPVEDRQKLLDRATAKLEKDTADFEEFQIKYDELKAKAGDGGRSGLVHDLALAIHRIVSDPNLSASESKPIAQASAALKTYVQQYGEVGSSGCPIAAGKLPELKNALALLEVAKKNAERDVLSAKAAMQEAEAPAQVSDDDVSFKRASVDTAKEALKEHGDNLQKLLSQQKASADAGKVKQAADKHHADFQAWSLIKDALSPSGIPSKIVESAIKPFNDRLAQSAVDTGWAAVAIDSDMRITYGDYEYSQCSASEKYRADTMIAEAISHFSGLKLLLLDAFDILEANARVQMLEWLCILADENEVDTVIALGTLSERVSGLPDTFYQFRLESGQMV